MMTELPYLFFYKELFMSRNDFYIYILIVTRNLRRESLS